VRVCGDDFRGVMTAIVIFLFFSCRAFAAADFNFGSTVRSYPLSGELEADGGYDFLLGGATTSPLYGYLRPHIDGSSALTYNQLGGSVDFYPISFLGGRFGGESVQNDSKYHAYDCETYNCLGRFYRTYAQAELTLGAGPVFVQGRWRRERWTQGTPGATSFIEPTSGLALNGSGDSQTLYRGTVGIKLSPNWMMAGILVYYQADSNREISRFPFAVVRYVNGPYSVGVGGGVFSSALKSQEASALLFLNWNVKPSLALGQ
jgi:hypothetical protein